jgi:hypothetical protein
LARRYVYRGESRRMINPTNRSGPASQAPRAPIALPPKMRSDVASVAHMWAAASYDDLRRAGPERAARVRQILDSYVVPWFAPRTRTIRDVSYFMAHEWLPHLVVRRQHVPLDPAWQRTSSPSAPMLNDAEFTLRQEAEASGMSLSTARRHWRNGKLPGAYRDAQGAIAVSSIQMKHRTQSLGRSQAVVADTLWVLRRVLAFARANCLVPPGFDPTEGLQAPAPDVAVARTPPPSCQPCPLAFHECARIASHLHPVHQVRRRGSGPCRHESQPAADRIRPPGGVAGDGPA